MQKLDRLVTVIKEHENRYGENKYNKNPYTDFEVLEDFVLRSFDKKDS